MRLMTERYVRQSIDLPQYQSRTCNHCGRRTTFALQDRAGWYACIQCGRFAWGIDRVEASRRGGRGRRGLAAKTYTAV